MTVKSLINLLSRLPSDALVFTAGDEGVHLLETGNLMPIRVLENQFKTAVYIDDGLGDHGIISEQWKPLDEYQRAKAN